MSINKSTINELSEDQSIDDADFEPDTTPNSADLLDDDSSIESYRYRKEAYRNRHDKAYRKQQEARICRHKEYVVKYVYRDDIDNNPYYNKHRLSKGKIHCSCPLCSEKTKTRGWKTSDRRKIEKGDFDG